jgi:hypothetical protein
MFDARDRRGETVIVHGSMLCWQMSNPIYIQFFTALFHQYGSIYKKKRKLWFKLRLNLGTDMHKALRYKSITDIFAYLLVYEAMITYTYNSFK